MVYVLPWGIGQQCMISFMRAQLSHFSVTAMASEPTRNRTSLPKIMGVWSLGLIGNDAAAVRGSDGGEAAFPISMLEGSRWWFAVTRVWRKNPEGTLES